MRRLSLLLFAALFVVFVSCKGHEAPAAADTTGNATDRAADGTSGTGQPASVATDSAASATAMGTVAPTGTGGPTGFSAPAPIAVTGTTVVTPTDTTSTIKMPNGATTTQKH